jgi:dipeptidyl aminopeptidase/acylaminoacyl peptidase
MRAFGALVILLCSSALADPSELFLAGKKGKLQAFLYRPAGPGPFPALVYNHGSEKEPFAAQGEMGPYLSQRGYVVLFPMRRGSGRSEGTWWRDIVQQHRLGREQRTIDALSEENDDVVSAIEWLRAQPWVKRDEISVAGCSFGGIQTLLTAEKPLGLHAAIDFAGAAMSWDHSSLLRERLVRAAENAKTPIFFVQAENDFNTAPSKLLSEVMRKKGLPFRLRIFPPHGDSHMAGHAGFCNHGSAEWGPDVLDFLKRRQ